MHRLCGFAVVGLWLALLCPAPASGAPLQVNLRVPMPATRQITLTFAARVAGGGTLLSGLARNGGDGSTVVVDMRRASLLFRTTLDHPAAKYFLRLRVPGNYE